MVDEYRVARNAFGVRLFKIENGLSEIAPDRSLELRRYATGGFNYGLPGGGANQLALAILLDHFAGLAPAPEAAAIHFHERFAEDFLERDDDYGFSITARQIVNWLTDVLNGTPLVALS